MAGKSELQKSLSFRLNLSKENERELYEAITGHNRDNENDPYGSSGAYIKAALKCYHGNEMLMEQQEHFKEEMQEYLQRQVNEQRELFLKALEVHDQKMVAMIVESVASTLARMEMQPFVKTHREENNTSSRDFLFDEEIRTAESEIEEYYREVKAAIAGSTTGTSNNDSGEGQFAEDSGRGQEIIQGRIRGATDFKSEFGERKEDFDGERISLKERLGVCQQEAGKREEERKLDEQTYTRTRGRSR